MMGVVPKEGESDKKPQHLSDTYVSAERNVNYHRCIANVRCDLLQLDVAFANRHGGLVGVRIISDLFVHFAHSVDVATLREGCPRYNNFFLTHGPHIPQ